MKKGICGSARPTTGAKIHVQVRLPIHFARAEQADGVAVKVDGIEIDMLAFDAISDVHVAEGVAVRARSRKIFNMLNHGGQFVDVGVRQLDRSAAQHPVARGAGALKSDAGVDFALQILPASNDLAADWLAKAWLPVRTAVPSPSTIQPSPCTTPFEQIGRKRPRLARRIGGRRRLRLVQIIDPTRPTARGRRRSRSGRTRW